MNLPALLLCALTAAAPETAERLPYSSEYDVTALTDGNYQTTVNVPESGISITSDKPVYGAYIVWDTLTACTVEGDGVWKEIPTDYLHQYIELDGVTDFRISPYEDAELCELYVYSEGEPPREVQRWEPVLSRCDILVMPTHADDEVLMFGGTLPYYAGELGLDVQVVYMTNHLDEQPRPHELLDSVWACGVTAYPIISEFPDIPCWTLKQAMGVFDEDAVTEFQAETIRRVKPSVIVAHDINGEYGHGAHMLNCYTLMKALELTANPEEYPESAEKYGVWDVPKTYIHFWEENPVQMDWERPLQSFGGITAREAAEYAYSFHKSQHIWGYSVNYAPLWDCRQFGLYRTLVGTDTTADFMENITPVSAENADTPPETVSSAEDTDIPTERETASAEDTDFSAEKETVSAEDTDIPTKKETVSAEDTDIPTKRETASAEDTDITPEKETTGKNGTAAIAITAALAVVCFTAAIIIKKVRK